jgi:hypothetical protein
MVKVQAGAPPVIERNGIRQQQAVAHEQTTS